MTVAVLHGVGVGPGDPELLTLKGARLIEEADVVFCPAGKPGRARTSAAAHLHGKRVIELDLEMRGDRDSALDAAAATVVRELGGGRGVFLTEGDPALYSTFGLLAERLASAAQLEIRWTPGVSAITAAAAAAGRSLVQGDEILAVIPASAPAALVDDALSLFDATVVLKPSMAESLATRLQRLDLLDDAVLVREASGTGQTVTPGATAAGERPAYFSTWLDRGRPRTLDRGRVHFVGAGPGSAQHLTRRALSLIRRAGLLVAADSLVTPEVTALARGTVVGSSPLSLEAIVEPMVAAARRGDVVVRLHSGDPAVFGAVSEQMALLRAASCPYDVVPGVSSLFAAAAALGVELTEPGGSQTIVITRHGRRVPTPERERLRELAAHRCTVAVFLSAAAAVEVERELLDAGLDPDTPVAIAYRVSWPDELVERTTVAGIASTIRRLHLRRHTLILVGDALAPGTARSRLYDSGHAHVRRGRSAASMPALQRPPAVVALSRPGHRLAERLARSMPGAPVHSGGAWVPRLFREGTPVVAVMAVGAAVRLLAPVLHDKRAEPPVVVVDDAGRFSVSLVGGRAAGGNRLASFVASLLGAEAVVTSAAERLGRPALDEALAELGWRVEPGSSLTPLEAAVVNGEPVGFYGPGVDPPPLFEWEIVAEPGEARRAAVGLAATDAEIGALPPGWALARPCRLVVGFGCSSQATAAEAIELVTRVLCEAQLAPAAVAAVATIDRRADHPAARGLAAALDARLCGFSSSALDAVPTPNGSERVQLAVGTASVAEAAALLESGGALLAPKAVGRTVTVAVAERPA